MYERRPNWAVRDQNGVWSLYLAVGSAKENIAPVLILRSTVVVADDCLDSLIITAVEVFDSGRIGDQDSAIRKQLLAQMYLPVKRFDCGTDHSKPLSLDWVPIRPVVGNRGYAGKRNRRTI